MGPQDDFGLQEAIKTTLVQLCKVGVIYHCELSIAGTVGVTVDRKRTILVHFDERVDPCQPDTSTFSTAVANQSGSSLNLMGAGSTGLPCSPTQTNTLNGPYPDLATFSPVGSSSTKNETFSQTLQTSIPIPIDIDSDSESLCELRFEDDVIEVAPPSSMVRKKEVMWSGEDEMDPKLESKSNVDIKTNQQERVDSIARLMAGFGGPPPQPPPTTTGPIMTSSPEVAADTTQILPPPQHTQPPNNPSQTTPIKLLVDKRLFLKKTPEKTPTKLTKTAKGRQTRSQTRRRSSRSYTKTSSAAASSASISTTSPLSPFDFLPSFEVIATKDTVAAKARFSCEVCGKTFQTQGLLEAHLVEAHGVVHSVEIGDIVHYPCKHCNKKFRYQATLDKHEFLHVAAKPHKCHICGNTYCYAESLQIHMNIHAGILDCPICQKMYSSRKHLQKHIVYMHEMRRVRSGTTPKKTSISLSMVDNDENDEEEAADKQS